MNEITRLVEVFWWSAEALRAMIVPNPEVGSSAEPPPQGAVELRLTTIDGRSFSWLGPPDVAAALARQMIEAAEKLNPPKNEAPSRDEETS